MRETWVQSLHWEDSLEKGTATYSSINSLENSVDCRVHGVTQNWTWPSDFSFRSLVKLFQKKLLPYSVSQKIFLWILPIMQKLHAFWHVSLKRKRHYRKSAAFPMSLQTLGAQRWLQGPYSRADIGFHWALFLLSVFWLSSFKLVTKGMSFPVVRWAWEVWKVNH